MASAFNQDLFNKMPVVGIMRHFPETQLDPVVSAYMDAGLNTLEITMNSANAIETIRRLRESKGASMNIGAGTVCSVKDLDAALEAGAQFIVAPIVNKAVIKACVKKEIPVFPGAMTPTEIYKAWKWGATMVKVFPAGRLGPAFLKDVLEPLHHVRLLPTGGVNPDNFTEFLKHGASGVGMASALFPKDLIASGDWAALGAFYKKISDQFLRFKNENS